MRRWRWLFGNKLPISLAGACTASKLHGCTDADLHNAERNGVIENVKALSKGTIKTMEMVKDGGGEESYACGDIFDEQLARCFMMNPEMISWFGGYSENSGKFASDLALRFKGIVDPGRKFQSAPSSLPLGRHIESYLAECIYYLVLESHSPHQIVNLLFTITN